MRTRCSQCGARLTPAMRRCQRCGVEVVRGAPLEIVTLARPPVPYASGDRVAGRYVVLENHGAGPLGAVYRARAEDGRSVALRILHPVLLPGAVEREAFAAEYRKLVGRTLPHVMLPIEVAVDDSGVVFVASPWVYGTSLRRLLRAYRLAERRLDPDQILGVLQGTIAALRELHTISSHGALYPESVLITADAVVLVDPGVAPVVQPARFAAHLAGYPDVAPYLAPEVRGGRRPNAGADLYAVGALASELLTGDPARGAAEGFTLPASYGPALAEAVRNLLAPGVTSRAGALPQLLERLARAAGAASLPMYSPLPAPIQDERTVRAPRPVSARATAVPTAGPPAVHLRDKPGP